MTELAQDKVGNADSETLDLKIGVSDFLVVVLVLFYALSQGGALMGIDGLPSPFYGGDLFHQLGSVYHISQSWPPGWFTSQTFRGGLPICMPVYGVYVSSFVWLFGLTPLKALLFSSVFAGALIPIAVYLMLKDMFGDGFVALAGAMMFFPLSSLPLLRYTAFARYLMTPVFAYALYAFFFKEASRRNAVLLGAAFGLLSITHTTGFIISVSFTAFFGLAHAIRSRKMDGGFSGFIRRQLKWIALAVAIGLLISMTYWFKPIFVHRGVALNDIQEWTFPDYGEKEYQRIFIRQTLGEFLLNFSTSAYRSILSLLALAGIAIAFNFDNKSNLLIFVRWFFLASFLLSFSYFVTEPLIGTNFLPERIAPFTMGFSVALLALVPLVHKPLPRNFRILVLSAVILLAAAENIDTYSKTFSKGDIGRVESIRSDYASLQDYLSSNTSLNDVFLSTNELSFAVNSVSGRKVLVSRRAHSDVFVDYDERALDAAIILYGNNTKRKLRLLRKYDVKYLYWDVTWLRSEYRMTEESGVIIGVDPIALVETPERIKALEENDIDYFKLNSWLDPAIRGRYIKKMDLLFVSHKNHRSGWTPWREDLDPYLIRVWNYTQGGNETSVLYEFNQSMISDALA